MDMPMGEDLYDSFINYQRRVIAELDRLSDEYGFHTLDATRDVEDLSNDLCAHVSELLARRDPESVAAP